MSAPELKPCPFCEGRDIRWTSDKGITVNKCLNCHAQGPVARWDLHHGSSAAETMHMRRDEAQRLWETRADIPAARIAELEAEVKRLLDAIADTPERSRIEELEHQADRDTDRIHDLSDEVERLREANAELRAALNKDATP
ncbi:Lar family restriction alleviation protein [Yoonia sp.]|uniref:Lar family restriction alleviation protein n=1 Tax=Yoonia sp. TaxID=2212373 RepID=UPI002E086CAD|nr:Lar family restriction alleviation protein [Yoonia sp.]